MDKKAIDAIQESKSMFEPCSYISYIYDSRMDNFPDRKSETIQNPGTTVISLVALGVHFLVYGFLRD